LKLEPFLPTSKTYAYNPFRLLRLLAVEPPIPPAKKRDRLNQGKELLKIRPFKAGEKICQPDKMIFSQNIDIGMFNKRQ
jgi:hypothetical protein